MCLVVENLLHLELILITRLIVLIVLFLRWSSSFGLFRGNLVDHVNVRLLGIGHGSYCRVNIGLYA